MSAAADISAWDATPRDRAVTRGLLDGLGRPRGRFFLASLPTEIVVGLLSLGTRPLWIAAVRADRWRRYEWLLLGEFATWWHARTGEPEAQALAAVAERLARPRQIAERVEFGIAGTILLLVAFAWWNGPLDACRAVVSPFWLGEHAAAYTLFLALAWYLVWHRVREQRSWSRAWFGRLSRLLVADGRRPIEVPTVALPKSAIVVALLLAIIGPFWLASLVATLAYQNAVTRSFRGPKLRLVERMLERMDSSEWQVEYDVEAMNGAQRSR